jgi:hypothetical protein
VIRPLSLTLLLLAALGLSACGGTAPRAGGGEGAVIADLAPLPPEGGDERP